ncbi:flagellar hook-basal body protein [Chitinimonas lacunae]|uniref:Flagellar hook-basal body protein n=1 Tax=Chitinimonas lacunae TaxID=1963018 RepID=A0ABV8MWY2_9NEIS
MIDALYIGASGMQAQQLQVDTIANNLTNMNTPAFKKSRVSFHDVIQRELVESMGDGGVLQRVRGAGVGIEGTAVEFAPGDLKATGSSWDVAIRGNGFIAVEMPDGSLGYSRGGTLRAGVDGFLTTEQGYRVHPALQVPSDAKSLRVEADGRVSALIEGSEPVELGMIDLAGFTNPAGLQALGGGVYRPTERSGDAVTGRAGENGLGELAQGQLEMSNVKMIDEMVSLMLAQRAYEMSTKLVQAADEMMALTNNMRR